MKRTITTSILAIVFITLLAMPAMALTLSRNVPTTATPGQVFTVTYSTSGAPSGRWFVAWDDTITGGCTPANYRNFMALETGGDKTDTMTFTAPSSGSCTFTGFYQEANGAQVSMPNKVITIGVAECTGSETAACTVGSCAGTKTCANGVFGQCIKTDPNCGGNCTTNWRTGNWSACVNSLQTRTVTDSNNCGVTTGKPATSQSCTSGGGGNETSFDFCSIAEKAAFFKITDSPCTNGIIIIVGGIFLLLILLRLGGK